MGTMKLKLKLCLALLKLFVAWLIIGLNLLSEVNSQVFQFGKSMIHVSLVLEQDVCSLGTH